MTTYYRDLREYLDALDRAGWLMRISRELNKDTEIHPLVRLQFRGLPSEQRKGFIFENVTDARGRKYEMPYVVGCYAANRQIYALGMQCRPEEIYDRWLLAQTQPIDPVVVDRGPCQERVVEGEELRSRGLDMFPVPISTPGFDTAPFTTASHFVTKDPQTGVYNVGNYRGQVKAPDRIGAMCGGPYQGMALHWGKYRALGQAMPAAVVIGVTPNISYAATARIAHGLSEYAVAGAIAGSPVELVRCKSIDLLVPACAEIVLEGTIPIGQLEREGPFGEFPGYMASAGFTRFMDLRCITMRQDPLFVGFISQFPPSESSVLRGVGFEGAARKQLADAGLDNVLDVAVHESTGSWGYTVVKIQKSCQQDVERVFDTMKGSILRGKVLVVVDHDIDARDADSVNWALAFRMQPHRDVRQVEGLDMGLDPSIAPPSAERATRSVDRGGALSSVLFIDATMPWPYPPTSLPRREFMEHAVQLWNELGLPHLQPLKEPWFGYELGYVDQRARDEAELALRGEHFEIGRRLATERRRL